MRFGLSVYDITAAELTELAMAAEAAGFESLWLGEHVLMPVNYRSVHPTREPEQEQAARIVGPDTRLVDPLVALAGAAARTTRLQLGTAIYLLPLRHPLTVARAVLTLHELSGGRLLFGAGVGWLRMNSKPSTYRSGTGPAGLKRASTCCGRPARAACSLTMATCMTSGPCS